RQIDVAVGVAGGNPADRARRDDGVEGIVPEAVAVGRLVIMQIFFGHAGIALSVSSLPATNAKRLRKGALATKQSILLCYKMDCFAEYIIGRAFARPVGSQ